MRIGQTFNLSHIRSINGLNYRFRKYFDVSIQYNYVGEYADPFFMIHTKYPYVMLGECTTLSCEYNTKDLFDLIKTIEYCPDIWDGE